jgi:uncharacterized protein YcbK (DUF882 family)
VLDLLGSWLPLLALLFGGGAAVRPAPATPSAVDTPLGLAERPSREAAWTRDLPPMAVVGSNPGATAVLHVYAPDGAVDPATLDAFDRLVAAQGSDPHALSERLVQLVYKAAAHFGKPAPDGSPAAARVLVVSAWREHAGRHTTGDALDFKLEGIRAATLAAWLRGLPRAGVGIYTHARTQYVHLDVREPSYHWMDGSPPGVTWKERQLRDPGQVKRDASWTPESDLPL